MGMDLETRRQDPCSLHDPAQEENRRPHVRRRRRIFVLVGARERPRTSGTWPSWRLPQMISIFRGCSTGNPVTLRPALAEFGRGHSGRLLRRRKKHPASFEGVIMVPKSVELRGLDVFFLGKLCLGCFPTETEGKTEAIPKCHRTGDSLQKFGSPQMGNRTPLCQPCFPADGQHPR